MATNFPTSLDAAASSTTTDYLSTTPHSTLHNNLEDRTVALETKVGIDSSADTDSHDYKIATLETDVVTAQDAADAAQTAADAAQDDIDDYAAADQVVTLTGTQTLTNKTLTTPSIGSFANAMHYHTDDANGGSIFQFTSGMILPYAGSSAPTGWMICDGSAISRVNYANLFTVCSTTYGSGDGSTTFNIPNLKGKTVVGYNSAEGEFDALGETGGAKTVTLTSAQSGLPAHNHTQNAHTHKVYSPASNLAASGSGVGNELVGASVDNGNATQSTTATNIANTAADASSSHNNLQPYITLNYIIKT